LATDEQSSMTSANLLATDERSHYRENASAMSTADTQSPEELAAMRKMLVAMAEEKGAESVITMLVDVLGQAQAKNTQLQTRVEQLLRQLYGRKSEKVSAAQLSFLLQGLVEQAPATAQVPDAPTGEGDVPQPSAPPRKVGGRRPRRELPADLPRETKKMPVPAAERVCAACGTEKTCIGQLKSEVLEFVPAHFKIVELLREKVACPKCESGVVTAPSEKVMDRGRPGPGLLANLLVEKFQDAMPLYRQAQGYERCGVSLSESTLGDWSAFGCDVIEPLAKRLAQKIIASDYVRADDTTLRVLDREHANGVKRGHMWAFVANHQVAFHYAPDWKAERVSDFLRGFTGHLQGDGYAGYEEILEPPEGRPPDVPNERRLGCGMHVRRKFQDAANAGDPRGAIALSYFKQLYRIEEACKAEGLGPEARLARRKTESLPILDELYRWIYELHLKEVPKTPLHKALVYAVNQEQHWRRCFSDGRFEIDNGETERQLRRVALGRKNYLFAGSDKGAERIAVAYSLLGTCHMNGVNPLAYLTDVIEKLQNGWPNARIDEILPGQWKPGLTR
jgi:transposase